MLLLRIAAVALPEAMTTTAYNAIDLNVRAEAFAIVLGMLAAACFGVPAAVVASRSSILALLGSGSRSATASATSRRLRSGLVVLEVTVCTTLLIGAALMTRSFVALESAGKGFDAANLISVRIALPSSGVHSNGYSLVRRLVVEAQLGWDAPAPFAAATSLAEALLMPTRIYVRPVLKAIRATGAAKGLAHITGGGLSENLPRILPAGLAAHIDLAAWQAPAVFGWLRQIGNLDDAEMLRTFNCGIGLMLVVGARDAEPVLAALLNAGETAFVCGQLAAAT